MRSESEDGKCREVVREIWPEKAVTLSTYFLMLKLFVRFSKPPECGLLMGSLSISTVFALRPATDIYKMLGEEVV